MPHKLLFLAANPSSTARLRVDAESREIGTRIAQQVPGSLEVQFKFAITPDDLLESLLVERPAIVHFSGHGSPAGIVLEGRDGAAKLVSAEALARTFEATRDRVRIVVLNACDTRQHAAAVAIHVDCVVGMEAAIGDVAARVFAASFYRALARGRSAASAFEQGIAAIHLEETGEHVVPRLHCKDGVDPRSLTLEAFDHRDEHRRVTCTITLRATLDELDPRAIGIITAELRRLARDISIEITDLKPGSVHATFSASHRGARHLGRHYRGGEPLTIAGYDVIAFSIEKQPGMLALVRSMATVRGHVTAGWVSMSPSTLLTLIVALCLWASGLAHQTLLLQR
jgi:hypothetical protein